MKYKIILLSMTLAITACKDRQKIPDTQSKQTVDTKKTAAPVTVYTADMVVNKNDIACKMPLNGHINDTAHYHGKVYGFCSAACKKNFQSDPTAYVKD